jgi:phage gpG-like protein
MQFIYSLNSQPVDKALENFELSLSDQSPALRNIADDLREMIAAQFATEGRAGGTPWAPLADTTLRKSRGSRSGILNLNGALRGSLVERAAPGHVEELDAQSLLFGSRLPYALFHQTGTGIAFGRSQPPSQSKVRKGRNNTKGAGRGLPVRQTGRALPMRPMIVMADARVKKWLDIVGAQIEAKSQLLGTKELE